jgi:hypothetical protein
MTIFSSAVAALAETAEITRTAQTQLNRLVVTVHLPLNIIPEAQKDIVKVAVTHLLSTLTRNVKID